MSFRENSNQQITLSDSLWGLTPREKKALIMKSIGIGIAVAAAGAVIFLLATLP